MRELRQAKSKIIGKVILNEIKKYNTNYLFTAAMH